MLLDTELTVEYMKSFTSCGFIPGHKYKVFTEDLGRDGYGVNGIYDITVNKTVDLFISFSTMNGLEGYFKCD